MTEPGTNDIWQELKDIWKNSTRTEKINIQMSALVGELKNKISQFEKDSIKHDISFINKSISQFEKESIQKDFARISRSIKNLFNWFKRNK